MVYGEQKCSICKEYKPLSEFRKQSRAKLGVKGFCRLCDDEYQRKRYGLNKTKIKGQVLDWQKNNQDKVKEYHKRHLERKPLKQPKVKVEDKPKGFESPFDKDPMGEF